MKNMISDFKTSEISKAVSKLREDERMRLITITCYQKDSKDFEILYHFSNDETGTKFDYRIVLRYKLNEHHVPTIIDSFPNTLRYEQEINELFGLWFDNNPEMGKRLFLPENMHEKEEHPHLRK